MKKDLQIELRKEFENYLQYWLDHMFRKSQASIYPEITIDQITNPNADMGSMYLSRIIYGASIGSQILGRDKYIPLADTAFDMLTEFKNPSGGYFWGRKYNMEWLDDIENVNMAQAFVLYGLAEYARLNESVEVNQLIDAQVEFIESTLKVDNDPYYLDGFNTQWARGKYMTRAFATHFHVTEALVKVYENKKDENIKSIIQVLLEVILDRFIDQENYFCIHRFTEDWQMLPNENWAGHNAECSWVICHAAKAIKDKKLIERTEKVAVKMMDRVVELAKDTINGGYANVISDQGKQEEDKFWWPQAEVVLGLLNVYQITGEENYQILALDQISYIQKYFVNNRGEWYTGVKSKGDPLQGEPQVFFWKSMYHTVRYYDYLLGYFQA
ncbi:MAG: hypothetical protein GY908_07935 [Flavobacteriales bacterium]|nr:hypothetical protein [Flavobacteriales bacterium]